MPTLRVLAAVALAAAGIATSVAIAGPPPGKGKDKQTTTAASTQTSTGETSTTSTVRPSGGKVVLCHLTHSAKKPFVKIRVSAKAAAVHRRHGDVEPDASGNCPKADIAPPGGTTTATTTTGTTTSTTSSP